MTVLVLVIRHGMQEAIVLHPTDYRIEPGHELGHGVLHNIREMLQSSSLKVAKSLLFRPVVSGNAVTQIGFDQTAPHIEQPLD